MVRTQQQITAEIEDFQAKYTELSKLTTTSQTGVFTQIKNLWVLLNMALDQRVGQLISQITALIGAAQVGSLSWYANTIKAFQFGDYLTVYEGARIGYASVNADKQIVKQCTVTEGTDGRLLAKVAKSVGGVLAPLQSVELDALKEYIRQIKYAGVIVDCISLPADELRLEVTIRYDRLVLNASGQLLTDVTKYPALDAIKAYLQALPFDSTLRWTELTDYLQKQAGVADFVITRTYSRVSGVTAWTEFSRETVSRAGYMSLNLTESILTYV
ncbi:hypothetical protein [Spirosoma aerolatum]|uniref:hypothetical protein n=1 Tax=Spirosoma aerolatum TaxID=1211326 RepID=UPI0009AD419B|nr:hypothetical protein [Spirosoma aerolatum]